MQGFCRSPRLAHGKVEVANALTQDDGDDRVDLVRGGNDSLLSISSGGANDVLAVPRSWDSPLVRRRPVHLAHADPDDRTRHKQQRIAVSAVVPVIRPPIARRQPENSTSSAESNTTVP